MQISIASDRDFILRIPRESRSFQGVSEYGLKSNWENRCALIPGYSWDQSGETTVLRDSLRASPSTIWRSIWKTDGPLFWAIPETNRQRQQYSWTALSFRGIAKFPANFPSPKSERRLIRLTFWDTLWEQFCLSDQSALIDASLWRNPL